MEIKKSNDIAMENKDTMANAASAFENFPLSRTVLQQNSKRTNIINAINKLLSMYHPDDGIVAYERVLKTVLVLCENFESNIQQQIISIVPLPKGASNEAIRDVMCKITGLISATNSMTTYQKIVPEYKLNTEVLTEKSKIHLNQNVLVNASSQNVELDENFVSSVPEVFRGFPPNEISMIHSHVRNVNYVYDMLDYNIPRIEPCIDAGQNFPSKTDKQEESLQYQSNLQFKWIHTPHLLYKNNAYQITTPSYQQSFLKSVDDKCFQLPIDKVNNYNQWNVTNISHISHQRSTCFKKKLCKTEIISNEQEKAEISNLKVINTGTSFSNSGINCCEFFHNEDQDLKKYNCNINENKMSNIQTQKYFDLALKPEQLAIQKDIYKMDVVCWNEEINTIINSQVPIEDNFTMDNFIVQKKLKTSFQHFLKRAEQETLISNEIKFIDFPIVSQMKSLQTVSATSKCWKFVAQKNLENKDQLDSSINSINNFDTNASNSIRKLSAGKVSGLSNIYPKPTQLQMFQKSLNIALDKTQIVDCEKKDNVDLLYKSAVKQTEQNNVNILQQTASVTKLATFKKHYYDTLLNIQQAKVAVANSLAISSVESSTKYDPYYSNCSYQQKQLLQQHGQLSVNPQFAVHTMTQSRLSNVHNTPYTWVRYNDWRHPTVRQLRIPQQSLFHHSRNKENSILHYVKTVDIQCFAQDKSKEMKQCVQRKKLEDIVGKLKEIENININD